MDILTTKVFDIYQRPHHVFRSSAGAVGDVKIKEGRIMLIRTAKISGVIIIDNRVASESKLNVFREILRDFHFSV